MSKTIKQILGEKQKETATVTVEISGEGANRFREFMQAIAKICNAGCSRELAITDPSNERERAATWSFDGDGNTRIEVK